MLGEHATVYVRRLRPWWGICSLLSGVVKRGLRVRKRVAGQRENFKMGYHSQHDSEPGSAKPSPKE